MTVDWEEHRWPRFVHWLLRLLRLPQADQAALRVQVDEPQALGRMTLEDLAGNPLCALIDCMKNRKKSFYLPASVAERGFALKSEAGVTLFSWGIQARDGVGSQSETGSPEPDDTESPQGEEAGEPEAVHQEAPGAEEEKEPDSAADKDSGRRETGARPGA